MLNEFSISDVDAISPTIGPFDLLAGGLAARGGLRLALTTVQALRQTLTRGPKLNATQELNLSRFINKIPANSKNTVEIIKLRNGNIRFKANSPGKSPGSRAVYEKTIDPKGKTIDYRKITYDKRNNIIHTKNKFTKGK